MFGVRPWEMAEFTPRELRRMLAAADHQAQLQAVSAVTRGVSA